MRLFYVRVGLTTPANLSPPGNPANADLGHKNNVSDAVLIVHIVRGDLGMRILGMSADRLPTESDEIVLEDEFLKVVSVSQMVNFLLSLPIGSIDLEI